MAKLYEKNGQVLPASRIVIKADGYQTINPSEEMILADGWKEYVAPEVEETETPADESLLAEILREEINRRVDMDDATAKRYKAFIYSWEHYSDIRMGQIVVSDDKLWRAMDDMPVFSAPSAEERWEEIL